MEQLLAQGMKLNKHMAKKIGRNELCWCGSGRKYKHCHLYRSQETPVPVHEIQAKISKVYNRRYCLHPQAGKQTCKGDIIRAHSVQKSGGLKRIARNGHVYNFIPNLMDTSNKLNVHEPKLIGVQSASTFTGFCGFHDNKTFEPIEKHPFQSGQHHAFLLGYRALCRELFLKKANLELVPYHRNFDKGKSQADQIEIQKTINSVEYGIDVGVNFMQHHKNAYDEVLLNSDFSQFRYYAIEIAHTPSFLCSAITQPQYDFNGNLLQNVTIENIHLLFDHITFSIIATDYGGVIIFGWLGKSNSAKKFIKSLNAIPDDLLPDAITRFTFEYFENVYVSPEWWDSLDDVAQQKLVFRQMTETSPDRRRTAECLKDDGLRIVSWKVIARKTNLRL